MDHPMLHEQYLPKYHIENHFIYTFERFFTTLYRCKCTKQTFQAKSLYISCAVRRLQQSKTQLIMFLQPILSSKKLEKLEKKYSSYKKRYYATLQCILTLHCFFLIYFFLAHDNVEKLPSKTAHNQYPFFFITANQPKTSPNLNLCSIEIAHRISYL